MQSSKPVFLNLGVATPREVAITLTRGHVSQKQYNDNLQNLKFFIE